MSDEMKLDEFTKDFFQHFGVKGMRWGFRKDKGNSAVPKPPDSEDHTKAQTVRTQISTHGTRVVSNQELQTAIQRMNLEQQYSQLVTKQSTISSGQARVRNVLGVAKTINEIVTLANSPLGKAIKAGLAKG